MSYSSLSVFIVNVAISSFPLSLSEYEANIVKDYTAFKVSCKLKDIAVNEED